MTQQNDNCVFCRICNEEEQSEILYKDDEYVVFPDIKPAARHHYLIVTRKHIRNAKQLTMEHKSVVENLVQIAKQVLNEKGADLSDVRTLFHPLARVCDISPVMSLAAPHLTFASFDLYGIWEYEDMLSAATCTGTLKPAV